MILHGAGSAKESHLDFGRVCRERRLAALAYDARGHGRSDGEFGPGAIDDVLAMCGLLREHVPAVALRGSSLGGLPAILAAARDPDIAAVVAICPAPETCCCAACAPAEPLTSASTATRPSRGSRLDVYDAVARLGTDTALLLLHARGDEQVPYTVSEELHAAAHEPKRLLLMPGGHHRSLQHDVEIQNLSARFIEDAVAR